MTKAKETVLIVDDQQNWLDVLSKGLEKDYVVETAANYEDAKAILQQKAFLLAIIDIRLVDEDEKNVDGIRLLADLRQLADGASAIIITGYPELKTAKDAVLKYNAFDYVLKYPEDGSEFNLSAFREIVHDAIKLALDNRQKAITLEFELDPYLNPMSKTELAGVLAPELDSSEAAQELDQLLRRLLYEFLPLAPMAGWAKVIREKPPMAGVLCWSRQLGKALAIELKGSKKTGGEFHAVLPVEERYSHFTPHFRGILYAFPALSFDTFLGIVKSGK